MRLLRYIDRKYTLYDQRTYIITFLFFGMPIGYSFVQVMTILMSGWEKYHFSIYNLIGNITTNFLILSPFIINYIRHKRKFNKICKKIKDNPNNKYKVKALYTYSIFIKGFSYDIVIEHAFMNFDKQEIFIIEDNNRRTFHMENIINKFELDDIKEERMRKLKKLKKLW